MCHGPVASESLEIPESVHLNMFLVLKTTVCEFSHVLLRNKKIKILKMNINSIRV